MTIGDEQRKRLREAAEHLEELANQEARQCELLAESKRFESAVLAHKAAEMLKDTALYLRMRAAS